MSIDLTKKIIDLSKKALISLEKKGLEKQKSQVVLVLDISRSMNSLFKNGVIQTLIERILALALNFDDDGNIDIVLFGTNAYQLPSVSLDDLDGYVDRVILPNYKINEATRYSSALNLIYDKYKDHSGDPVFVIFVTDGNNSDKKESTRLIIDLAKESLFFQFVGIGNETFPYLTKLDDLPNRLIDNAGFMHVMDISKTTDSSLYENLLNEYPDWLAEASKIGII